MKKAFKKNVERKANVGNHFLFTITVLTLYHTIMSFYSSNEKAFRKHCGKSRKCCLPAFSPFPQCFPNPYSNKIYSWVPIILSSEKAINLHKSKCYMCGKEKKKNITITSSNFLSANLNAFKMYEPKILSPISC